MIDLLILALILLVALAAIWLSIKILILLLPYLVIGFAGWLIWHHRSWIAKQFSPR